jgi:hypothetical protein
MSYGTGHHPPQGQGQGQGEGQGQGQGQGQEQRELGPLQGARPELAVAATALVACSIAAFVLAGLAGTVLVVMVFSALALAVFSLLLPRPLEVPPTPEVPGRGREATVWAHGYWRLQIDLREGTTSIFAYEFGLAPHLEHLLAARLSQSHGINLYTDPEAARRVLCANRRDRDLWAWVDPARRTPDRNNAAGIPPRTLARLVRRLEQL